MSEPTAAQAEAYDAGRARYAAGEDSAPCPYPPGSDLRLLYARGYQHARRDAGLVELAEEVRS